MVEMWGHLLFPNIKNVTFSNSCYLHFECLLCVSVHAYPYKKSVLYPSWTCVSMVFIYVCVSLYLQRALGAHGGRQAFDFIG